MNVNNLGMGVMISMLGGNEESVKAFTASLNKKIKDISLDDASLHLEFEDGYKIKFFDDGQSCCESRYMRTDDTLTDYIGATLLSAELKNAPNISDKYGEHEVQFLDIKTDKGTFTLSNHNEHNGYYGGFSIRCATEN